MNHKRKKRPRHGRAVGMYGKAAKRIYATADRVLARKRWRRDNELE